MNGKTFGGQRFAAPTEGARPGRGSVSARTGGRICRRAILAATPCFSGRVSVYVRPHPGPLPRGEGESSAAATYDNVSVSSGFGSAHIPASPSISNRTEPSAGRSYGRGPSPDRGRTMLRPGTGALPPSLELWRTSRGRCRFFGRSQSFRPPSSRRGLTRPRSFGPCGPLSRPTGQIPKTASPNGFSLPREKENDRQSQPVRTPATDSAHQFANLIS